MAGSGELAALLARAAAYGVTPVPADDCAPDAALGRVLDAIRGAILPRQITVHMQGALVLRAEASGGCLTSLTEAPGAGVEDLVGRPLRASDQGEVLNIAELLQDLFSGAQDIDIALSPPETAPDAMHSGLPADLLMRHLGLMPFAAAVEDPLAYSLDAAEELLLARVTPEGITILQDGFAPSDDLLRTLLDLLAQGTGPAIETAAGDIAFLVPQDWPDLALGFACVDDGPLALLIEAENLPELAAYWSGLPHGTVAFET